MRAAAQLRLFPACSGVASCSCESPAGRAGGREGNSKLCSEIKLALTAGPACHTEHEQEYRAVGSSHLSRPVNTMRQILEKYVNNLQVPVEKHKLENCSLDAVIFD